MNLLLQQKLCNLQQLKIAVFTYRSPHFCFSWTRPFDYHAICCMDEKTIQCLPNPSRMYLSIFNSFRVIRCLSQCVSPKIAIFTTFLFPLGTPLEQSRQMLYGWKENSMLTKYFNCLAVCAHLTITVFETERDIGRQSWTFYTLPCIRGNIAIPFGMEKLEWWGYPMVKKTLKITITV